jgi:uncharacterized protein YkwD
VATIGVVTIKQELMAQSASLTNLEEIMKGFIYILAVFMLIGCEVTWRTKRANIKPPPNDGVPVFYDWYEDPDSGLDCESLKGRYYPKGNDELFRAIIRSLEFQNFNVGTMTEFFSDHDGIGLDDEEQKEFIHLSYSCAYLSQGVITFTHKKVGKIRRIKLQNMPTLGELEDAEDFYTKSFGCLLDKECKPPKLKLSSKQEEPEEPEPATEVKKEGCKPGDRACLETERVEAPVSGPDAKLDRDKFLELLNAYRAEKSLEPLAYDDRLDSAAEGWAEYHADLEDLSSPKLYHKHGKSNPAKRVKAEGYNPSALAENLARVESIDPNFLLVQWKNSPDHDKNLLRPNVKHAGISCVYAPLEDETIAPWVCVLNLGDEKTSKAKKKKK